jgi:shikimate 5-dehydrogenase
VRSIDVKGGEIGLQMLINQGLPDIDFFSAVTPDVTNTRKPLFL